jgi:hypothetical protein
VPSNQQYAECSNRPAEKSEAVMTGAEEEALALTASCPSSGVTNPDDPLEPIKVTATGSIDGESQQLTPTTLQRSLPTCHQTSI